MSTKRKHVTVKVVTKPDVHMELSYEAASLLYMVLGSVGGSPAGPRGITQEIYDALESSGIKPDPDANIAGDLYLERA